MPYKKICKHCGKPFESKYLKRKFHCNKKCARAEQVCNRPILPRLKEQRGYVLVHLPTHPKAHRGYVYEHRIIVESHLKRVLDTDEIVHHLDGDRSNNRIENLQVMNQADHIRLHVHTQKSEV